MSGNWATGIARMAIRPARVMTIEITKARRGRSMKMSEIIGLRPPAPAHSPARPARVGPLDTIDDHVVTFLKACGDDHIGIPVRTGFDPSLLHLVLIIDHQGVIAGLVK